MLTQGDNSSVADFYFRDTEHSLQWQGAIQPIPDERPLFTACPLVYEAGNGVANGQWVSRRPPDSGPVNDPSGHVDAIDNTAGQVLSSLPSIRFSEPATQAKVARPSTSGEHERHAVRKTEWLNSMKCYSCGDSGHWQHSLKCPNSKRVIVGRPEKDFFSA